VDATQSAVYGIIAGRDEQLNWIRLNEYINICLPQPDGKNLPLTGRNPKPGGKPNEMEPVQVKYWNLDWAKQAAQDYYDRVKGGEAADAPVDDVLRENLCHVDIEAIYTYYVPNAKQFYDTAKSYTQDNTGRSFDGMLPIRRGQSAACRTGLGGGPSRRDVSKGRHDFPARHVGVQLGTELPANFPTRRRSATGCRPRGKGGPDDPINDRVTHVFLYYAWPIAEPKPARLRRSLPTCSSRWFPAEARRFQVSNRAAILATPGCRWALPRYNPVPAAAVAPERQCPHRRRPAVHPKVVAEAAVVADLLHLRR